MQRAKDADSYFAKEQPFKSGINTLREIVRETELEEKVKWGAPVYTLDNKNVVGVMAFKGHFGLWFFNGVFLSDPAGVLENAQEGKTKSMRHWKFTSESQIDKKAVRAYLKEAIENQRRGLVLKPERKKTTVIPALLKDALQSDGLQQQFGALSPGKQREYCEYIDSAKQEKTKLSRLEKILPIIAEGKGMNDKYRKA